MTEISTTNTPRIPLHFRLTEGWSWVWFTFIGVLLYQFFTLQRPDYGELGPLLKGEIWPYLRELLGYYVLFELLSVFIFIRLAPSYFRWTNMESVPFSLRGVILYEAKFLPYILGIILVFGPITNGLRYLVVFYPDYSWSAYFPEYFFTARMYINYLLPFFVFGYVLLNVNLFLDYHDWQKARFAQLQQAGNPVNHFTKTIEARDDEGETLLSVQEVWWFEVEEKNYRAFTQGKTFQIRKTLGELETELDPATFFRVNRGVIVNLNFVKNYSFWENDKYMLRLQDDKTEFVMQRTRLKELRTRLGA